MNIGHSLTTHFLVSHQNTIVLGITTAGTPGTQGPPATQATPGTAGPTGPPGTQGPPATQAPPGTAGPTGPPGTQGPLATQAPPGTAGPTGPPGTPGTGIPGAEQPTSIPKEDCIYDVTPEELAKDEPVTFGDDITADITPEGELVFEFPEPRKVSQITVKTPSGETLQV